MSQQNPFARNFSPFNCTRMQIGGRFHKARKRFGTKTVDEIIGLIHNEYPNKTFVEREKEVEKVLEAILNLQDITDKYFEMEEEYKGKSVLISDFEKIKDGILLIGKALEKDEFLFEALTCSVPLFRTLSSLYVKIQKERESNEE